MPPLRIIANLYAAQKASREMTGGILRYAAVHQDVEVRLYGLGAAQYDIGELRDWQPEGVIVSTDDAGKIRRIERIGCRAAVFVNVDPPAKTRLRCGSVFCDNEAIAKAAFGLFAGKRLRLRHFAFVGTREGEPWSVERGNALRDCAQQVGGTFASFDPPRSARASQRRNLAALARWAAGLPKPCGIFAANDLRAKDVIDACREAAIPVPEQVMVLGVNDEEFICRQVQPTLSSVVPDFEKGGYLAAETLVELLRGRQRLLPRLTFGVQGVVGRASTSDPYGAGRMVSLAEEFIRAYATSSDISVGEVAKASCASIRLLQKNFKAITGTTVCDAIQAARLQRVRKLLTETQTPIGQIGELCGFGDDAYLKKLFRRRFHCTMRDWRNGVRPDDA